MWESILNIVKYAVFSIFLWVVLFFILFALGLFIIGRIALKHEAKSQKAKQKAKENYFREKIKKSGTIDYNVLVEIATIISHGDRIVTDSVKECIEDYLDYMDTHYSERIIFDDSDAVVKEEVCWLWMVEDLIRNDYAIEIDWKTELEDILYFLSFITKKHSVSIDLNNLNLDFSADKYSILSEREPDDISTDISLQEISSVLRNQGCALGWIDIESDSYVLFFTEIDKMEILENLSEGYGRNIGFDFKYL